MALSLFIHLPSFPLTVVNDTKYIWVIFKLRTTRNKTREKWERCSHIVDQVKQTPRRYVPVVHFFWPKYFVVRFASTIMILQNAFMCNFVLFCLYFFYAIRYFSFQNPVDCAWLSPMIYEPCITVLWNIAKIHWLFYL